MSLSPQTESDVESCAVFQSVEILGGRYKLLVLRALIDAERRLRFGKALMPVYLSMRDWRDAHPAIEARKAGKAGASRRQRQQ